MRLFAEFQAPRRSGWRWLAVASLCLMAGLAQAQSATDDPTFDPPSRVARLSYLAGDLGFLPAGAKNWSDASINRPLTTGDRLSTGNGARAELELGGGTLRMDSQTDFGLLDLNEQLAQVELTQGTLNLTARRLENGQSYEIDTPTIALVVDQPGTFRVDVDRDGRTTEVTVLDGSAIVYGENNAQRTVAAGRRYRFDDSSLNAVVISDLGSGDAFDRWSDERDSRYAQSTTRQYVSDDVVGYQDLDQYGDWQTSDDYGAVWYPTRVASDWAPYRDGHWAYIAPWGWTWVDSSPWGFAPYHYGRWAYVGRRWGWIPGPIAVRPIYAPALVAFIGGGGWSVGVGGPVGWFPLGPGEIYNPWYRASRSYYTRVNVTNIRVTNVYNHTTIINRINNRYGDYQRGVPGRAERYVNRDAPRGVTAVSGKVFAGGHRVQGDLLRVDQRQLARATVLPRGVAQRPEAGSFARPRGAHARALPEGGFSRQVVARNAPPAVRSAHDEVGQRGTQPVAATPSNVRVLGSRRADSAERMNGMIPARVSPADRAQAAARGDRQQGDRLGRGRVDANGANPVSPLNGARPQERESTTGRAESEGGSQPRSSRFAGRQVGDRAPVDEQSRRTDLRDGELPSARFARPRGADAQTRGDRGEAVSPVTSPSRNSNHQAPIADNDAAAAPRVNAADRAVPAWQQRTPAQRATSVDTSPSAADRRFQRFDAERSQQRGSNAEATSPSRYGSRQEPTADSDKAATPRAGATDRAAPAWQQRVPTQRATSVATPPPAEEQRFQRFDAARSQQRTAAAPTSPPESDSRNLARPRMERFDRAPRNDMPAEPRPVRESPRPAYQPSYQAVPRAQPPAYVPPVRTQAAQPRAEPARPSHKKNGRGVKEDESAQQ